MHDKDLKDESGQELAEDRTELAEDRTLMAIERTMASWMGASFGAIGVGLGFRALFARIEPTWLPKLVASAFMVLAIVLVLSAERRAQNAIRRMSAHLVDPPTSRGLKMSAYGIATGAAVLIPALWLLYE